MIFLRYIFLFITLLSVPSTATWDVSAYHVITSITLSRLRPQVLQLVQRELKLANFSSLLNGTKSIELLTKDQQWFHIRKKSNSTVFHYLHDCDNQICPYTGLLHSINYLRNGNNDDLLPFKTQGHAIAYLTHFVSDLSNPIIMTGTYPSSLMYSFLNGRHSFPGPTIIKYYGNVKQWMESLKQKSVTYTDHVVYCDINNIESCAIEWGIDASSQLLTMVNSNNIQQLSSLNNLMETQLIRAGLRLARLLNEILYYLPWYKFKPFTAVSTTNKNNASLLHPSVTSTYNWWNSISYTGMPSTFMYTGIHQLHTQYQLTGMGVTIHITNMVIPDLRSHELQHTKVPNDRIPHKIYQYSDTAINTALVLAGSQSQLNGMIGVAPQVKIQLNSSTSSSYYDIVCNTMGIMIPNYWIPYITYPQLNGPIYVVSASTTSHQIKKRSGKNKYSFLNDDDISLSSIIPEQDHHSYHNIIIVTVAVGPKGELQSSSESCKSHTSYCIAVPALNSSQAAMIVTGVLALFKQQFHSLLPTDFVYATLHHTTQLSNSPNSDTGRGLLNVIAAYDYCDRVFKSQSSTN